MWQLTPGETRDIWIPKGTKNNEMGAYFQRSTSAPYHILEGKWHGQAPYFAGADSVRVGWWYTLQTNNAGKQLPLMTQSKYRPNQEPPGAATTMAKPIARSLPVRHVYFHAYVPDVPIQGAFALSVVEGHVSREKTVCPRWQQCAPT